MPVPDPFHGVSFAGKKGCSVSALVGSRGYRGWHGPPAFLPGHADGPPPERKPVPSSPESDQVVFVERTLRKAGLNPRHYRRAPLVRRIPACLRALKVDSLVAAMREMESSPDRLLVGLNSLLIGTTAFFRDRQVFDELQRHVLPELLGRVDRPRVWSAACSDGAELYSMAMMFDRLGAEPPVFLGTDCRASAIARAREGLYPLSATAEMPMEFVRNHVRLSGNTATVSPEIREKVSWAKADLLTQSIDSHWDLILCRNLAIYLAPEAMDRLWKKLSAAIRPGGYLIVGRAEKPRLEDFSCIAPCIHQKAPGSLA